MTEDELLEQIRKVDPDAHFVERGGYRVLLTTSIHPNTMVLLDPGNMHIIGTEPDDDV